MELAWHTQKNQITDVKGKEMEQERKGKLKNEDIDLSRTQFNYDLVSSDKNLYQRVKERVDFAKETGSRVQKNSVVMYSNILTVPHEQFEQWGKAKTQKYFEVCYDFFSREFGKENVVSAKVHLDETTPHMHMHFVPFNKETGKLQARVVMTPKKINEIHDTLPQFLREHGFDVERGKGKTQTNIEDIHEYKEVQRTIQQKQQELENVQLHVEKIIASVPTKKDLDLPLLEKEKQVTVIPKLLGKPEIVEKETENFVITPYQYKMLEERLISASALKGHYEYVVQENTELKNGEAYRQLEEKNNLILGEAIVLQEKVMNLEKQRDDLLKQNNELQKENSALEKLTSNLRLEINLMYLVTRDFLKEHTKTFESYKKVFTGLLGTFKERLKELSQEKGLKGHKSFLNEVNEHDPDFARTQQKKMPERDSGMER